MTRLKEECKFKYFLSMLAVALSCLMLSACDSTTDGADNSASLSASRLSGMATGGGGVAGGAGTSGGPIGPVGGGNGGPVVFGPNGPAPTPGPGPGPGPNDVIAVIYATDGGGITSFAVAPDGKLSVLERGLAPVSGITRLFLNPDQTVLYATDSRGAGKNFYTYSIDAATTLLTELGAAIDVGGYPSDFAFLGDTTFAYAINRNAAGFFGVNTVTSLISQPDGQLLLNQDSPSVPTGSEPNQLVIDSTSSWMYVINNGKSISIYGIKADGSLEPYTGLPDGRLLLDGTPRSLVLSRDGRFLFVSLQDINQVATYALQADGSLNQVSSAPVDGPGISQEHPTLPLLYVVSGENLVTLDIDTDGQTSLKPGTSLLPLGQYPSDIVIDPSQQYLYVFNFYDSFISCFRIEPSSGLLTPLPDFTGVSSIASAVVLPGPDL